MASQAKKKRYRKPTIKTESLTAVAITCNGTSTGGRKGSTAAPALCTASKLKS